MKHTARLTACLLALALTACTAAPQDMPAGTTTETAAAPAQTAEPTTETPAVQDTLTPIYTTWGAAVGQDAVYSAMNIDDAGQYFATTIDFSTGEQRILCKKLGCSHADESCPAYMTAIRNGCVPKAMLLPVGDRLYWLVDGRYNESDSAYLDVSNPDGSDRRRVAEGDDLPDLTSAYIWYTDGTALYTFVRGYDKYSVLRLDEGGAACLFTRSIPDGEDYFAVGCWQDKIVLQHSGGYQQQPLNPAGAAATDEELRAWLAADEEAQKEQTKNLCLLDTAGGMTDTDMTWGGNAGNVQLVHNGAAYVLNESGLVTKFDLTAGTAQTRQLDLQGVLYGVVEGARLELVPCQDAGLLLQTVRSLPQGSTPVPRVISAGCVVQVDRSLWVDMLRNLTLNAQRACQGIEGAAITLRCERRAGQVVFTVTDTGCGIPAADLPRVTEAFYMVDKSRSRAAGGSGIGLALCARIAGAHGAKLEITSTEHVGTTVTIAVPEVLPSEREADNDTQS